MQLKGTKRSQKTVAAVHTSSLVVRHIGHALHSARHDDVIVAGDDRLRSPGQGLHARGADLVDGGAGRRLADASIEGRLSGRRLALAGREDIAKDDLVDVLTGDARLLQTGSNGNGAQLGGLQRGELSLEGADGSSLRRDDEHFL